ncbi:MAG: serine hydrolase family protein [Rhodocyclaceae bacterium]|nr:serine hydrolase family protein [Rhodocyclaceae bacterium]
MLSNKAAGVLAAFSFWLAGCACGLPVGELKRLDQALERAGFEHRRLMSADFPVHAWLRRGEGEALSVVIEGDGAAWFNPRWPPPDPTPEHSQTAALAAALGGPVAYLARPCQFERAAACRMEHWTTARFAPELLESLDAALEELKRAAGAKRLRLVGHSGGGVMAVLLSLRRSDVSAVATFMAPLAVNEWTRMQGLSPLVGADPMRLPSLAVPSMHVAGGRDAVVPPAIVRAYAEAKGGKYVLWPEADHACWPIERARELIGSLP